MSTAARAAAWARRHPVAAAGAVYAVLALLMVSPALLPGRTLSTSDTFWFQVPWAGERAPSLERPANPDIDDVPGFYQLFTQYQRRALPQEVPLWNPHMHSGRPLHANSQSALFSPFTWVSFVLPFWASFAWVAALKLLVGALGTFLLARALGMRFAGALLAGLVYGFCLWAVTWVAFTDASVWVLIPWLLWLTDRLVRRPDGRTAAALALVTALQYFGGHPESSFHAMLATVAFYALRVAWVRREAGVAAVPAVRTTAAFAAALAGGAALAAVALVPFLELLFRSADAQQRAGAGAEFKLQLRFALGALLPDYWGRGTDTPIVRFQFGRSLYAGALPLMLAAAALIVRPNLPRVAIAGFGAACLAVAFGVPPVFEAVTALPVFDTAHNERLIVVYVLCLALLAGWGLDDLAGAAAPGRRARLAVLGLALVLLAVPVAIVLGAARVPLSAAGEALRVAWGFAQPPPLEDPAAPDVVRLASLLVWLAVAGLGAALLAARLGGRLAAGTFAGLALLLVAGDLFRAGMGQNPAIERDEATQPPTGAIRYLQSRRPARFVGVGLVPHNVLSMRYGLYDARGYDLPIERRYDRFWRREVSPELPSQVGAFLPLALTVVELRPERLRALSLLGVADVLSPPQDPPLRLEGLRLAYAGRDARVYANAGALPRAWVVGAQREVAGEDAALDAIARPGFDARREAVVERRLAGVPGRPAPGLAGTARIVRYEPDRIALRARSAGPGVLVLSDVSYPGWKARVDGREVAVQRVNYLMRGVRLPGGAHAVELRYEPASWRIGWIVSLLAAAALGGAALASRARARHPRARPTNRPPAS